MKLLFNSADEKEESKSELYNKKELLFEFVGFSQMILKSVREH
jgi:hypothetical protein